MSWCLLGVAVLAGAGLLFLPGKGENRGGSGGTVPANAGEVAGTQADAAAQGVQGRLRGRWVRPDGGYVLEIAATGPVGQARIAYYNPRPIHVSRAETGEDTDGRLRVFVELQDEGYPGSNYTLTYDGANDVLAGAYYQAVQKESFEVVFTRMK